MNPFDDEVTGNGEQAATISRFAAFVMKPRDRADNEAAHPRRSPEKRHDHGKV